MKTLFIAALFCGFAINGIAQKTSKPAKITPAKTSKAANPAVNAEAKKATAVTKPAPAATEKKKLSFAEMLKNADSSSSKPDSSLAPKQ